MANEGMGAIPNATTSMVKFVRTGDGLLVVAFNIALLVVPIISSALTPAQALKCAAVINGVAVVARTRLKMQAVVPGGGTATAREAAPGAGVTALVASVVCLAWLGLSAGSALAAYPTAADFTDWTAVD